MTPPAAGKLRAGTMVISEESWAELRGTDSLNIVQKGIEVIAVVWANGEDENAEANAAEIVRRWNGYEAMRELLGWHVEWTGGAIKPLFSEAVLYEAFGKDEGRNVLKLVRAIEQATS